MLRELGILVAFRWVLVAEIACLILSYGVIAFCTYVVWATSLMHRNFAWTLYHLAFQYMLSMAIRIAIVFMEVLVGEKGM